MFDCADRVRCASRRSDAHQYISRAKSAAFKISCAGVNIVFRRLDGAIAGVVTTGNYRLHQIRRYPEGWRTLRCVENAKSSGGTGSDVEEPSAVSQALDDLINCSGDV